MNKDKLFYIPNPRAFPSLRLFCFPYAGGSSNIYLNWCDHFPDYIELILIQPPGRGSRISESPHTCMLALIDELLENNSIFNEVPFVFFGHSLGSRVAYELACQLDNKGLPSPKYLIASGSRAPHIPVSQKMLHTLSDEEFTEELRSLNGTPIEILQNPELLELLLPMLRADFRISDTYQAQAKPLSCPISVFHGINDIDIEPTHIEAWEQLTLLNMKVRTFEGDHFFINQQREKVVEEVKAILSSTFNEERLSEFTYTPQRVVHAF